MEIVKWKSRVQLAFFSIFCCAINYCRFVEAVINPAA